MIRDQEYYKDAARWLLKEYLKDVNVTGEPDYYEINLIYLSFNPKNGETRLLAFVPLDPEDGDDTLEYAIYYIAITDATPEHEKGFVSVCRKKKTGYFDLSLKGDNSRE